MAQSRIQLGPCCTVPLGREGPPMTRSIRRPPPVAPASLAVLVLAASLAGCASTPEIGTDVAMAGMPNAELALRDSMRAVDAEMGKLGTLRLASATGPAGTGPVVPGELQKVVTFTWNGMLEDGVRKLAGDVGYAVSVVPPVRGQASVVVGVRTTAAPVIEAFQALGAAGGTRADVRVDPALRQVRVIYRPDGPGGLTS